MAQGRLAFQRGGGTCRRRGGRVRITTDHSFLCFSLQNPPKLSYTVRGIIRRQVESPHGRSGLPALGLVGGPRSRT